MKAVIKKIAPRQLLLHCPNKLHPCNDAFSIYRPSMDINDADMASLKNLVAAMIRLENGVSIEAMEQTLKQLFDQMDAAKQTDLGRSFIIWIKRVLKTATNQNEFLSNVTELSEGKAMLAQRAAQWAKDLEAKGFQQGIAQGIAQGVAQEHQLLVRLVKFKFRSADISHFESRLSKIKTSDALEQVGEWIVSCDTYTDLIAQMDSMKSV
jgi:hypothetical protein